MIKTAKNTPLLIYYVQSYFGRLSRGIKKPTGASCAFLSISGKHLRHWLCLWMLSANVPGILNTQSWRLTEMTKACSVNPIPIPLLPFLAAEYKINLSGNLQTWHLKQERFALMVWQGKLATQEPTVSVPQLEFQTRGNLCRLITVGEHGGTRMDKTRGLMRVWCRIRGTLAKQFFWDSGEQSSIPIICDSRLKTARNWAKMVCEGAEMCEP